MMECRCRAVSWHTGERCRRDVGTSRPWCPEHFRWLELEALLCEYRRGALIPAPVVLPNLDDISDPEANVLRLARFFSLLYGLRNAVGDSRPVPLGIEWAAWHLGLPEQSTRKARDRLLRRHAICCTNRADRWAAIARGAPRPGRLFAPGARAA